MKKPSNQNSRILAILAARGMKSYEIVNAYRNRHGETLTSTSKRLSELYDKGKGSINKERDGKYIIYSLKT